MVLLTKYGAQIIITPTYIMPPKPTCKVVKREGQRGARIDPKGCKVRTTKDAQGNKKKENKQGQQKIKRTTTKTDMRLAFAGSPQRHLIANWNDRPQNFRSNYKRNHNIVYDTGANITSMTPAALQHTLATIPTAQPMSTTSTPAMRVGT